MNIPTCEQLFLIADINNNISQTRVVAARGSDFDHPNECSFNDDEVLATRTLDDPYNTVSITSCGNLFGGGKSCHQPVHYGDTVVISSDQSTKYKECYFHPSTDENQVFWDGTNTPSTCSGNLSRFRLAPNGDTTASDGDIVCPMDSVSLLEVKPGQKSLFVGIDDNYQNAEDTQDYKLELFQSQDDHMTWRFANTEAWKCNPDNYQCSQMTWKTADLNQFQCKRTRNACDCVQNGQSIYSSQSVCQQNCIPPKPNPPAPTPNPGPGPGPGPSPNPSPGPGPGPTPNPAPGPGPGPSPNPSPGPGPSPNPSPGPGPGPGPSPNPSPPPPPPPAKKPTGFSAWWQKLGTPNQVGIILFAIAFVLLIFILLGKYVKR